MEIKGGAEWAYAVASVLEITVSLHQEPDMPQGNRCTNNLKWGFRLPS